MKYVRELVLISKNTIMFYITETLKNSDTVSDVISVKASICNVVVVLTHKDYLGQDEVRNRFVATFRILLDFA